MPRKGEKGAGWAHPSHPMHRPAGGGKPTATPGNTAAVQHGARSRSNRLVMPEAERLAAQIIAEVGFLQDPSYANAVGRWAVAQAWCDRLGAWLEEHGAVSAEGDVRPVLDALRMWSQRASQEADRLGLTPLARARLGRDVTAAKVDVARLMAELAREEERASESPSKGDSDGYRTST